MLKGKMNILKKILIIITIMIVGTNPSFSCEETPAELTMEKAIDSFKKSFLVFAIKVETVTRIPPKKRSNSFVSDTKKQISKLKEKINRTTNTNKKRILKLKNEGLETELTIYQAELNLDKSKIHLGYDGSYDGPIDVKTRVIKSYKGDFFKNQIYSVSSLRRSWGLCNDFINDYIYSAKAGDMLVIYYGEKGFLSWEKFKNKEEIDQKMLKVKKGSFSIIDYLLSLF